MREPNSIESYSALACIAIQANQNEMHGGQSVPHFDYAMAEGVIKTFRKEYERAFSAWLQIAQGLSADEAATQTRALLIAANAELRMAQVESFGRKLAENAPAELREPAKKAHAYAAEEALKNTDRRTYQAMEALIHNLNTMNSRAGAQVPFSSINYGTDVSAEGAWL